MFAAIRHEMLITLYCLHALLRLQRHAAIDAGELIDMPCRRRRRRASMSFAAEAILLISFSLLRQMLSFR